MRYGDFSDDFQFYTNPAEHIDFPKGYKGEVKPSAALDAAIAAGKATEIEKPVEKTADEKPSKRAPSGTPDPTAGQPGSNG